MGLGSPHRCRRCGHHAARLCRIDAALAAARALAAHAGHHRSRGGRRNACDPKERLLLTYRSGPLVVELEYRVASENARTFHNVMQNVQRYGQRNGAYGWSIGRDIADPSCGPSAITARHGSIICANATAGRARSAH
ncbi:MFS transporter [Bradyrhizobium sp. 193]|nr:MFS transporter [Bradyrhizobium sp. 84]MCK1349305.1 MFS transporter [Bradyrhizobium sp. CW11]MCK1374516.1 MFS transporter [Bradyrhizobium sp. 49]MCK1487576.1 MFS transporter [Bradyrhizobium sp. 193]MCK1504472.1 MFS transporter [Bradyrhizobium sp. 18]MCK1587710.1 MFS transporter [Bradyrhizobium sp. 169]MCK1602890.1 MFS transporter [Bradyrhizobium sp. 166]MCK1704667.1 MFS transporter [Bradyrhizobium sp. 146]